MNYEAVIGLEVHAQLLTDSKIFCGCSTKFGDQPNQNTCPVCLGLPGALPVLNRKAVELALRAALALDCRIPPVSAFARKNYFYPDLPKGYQITQYERPLAMNGCLEAGGRKVRINRLHLEEDAGKLIHEAVAEQTDASLVDFNRSGIPLVEIVTEPDIRTPAGARAFLAELKSVLRYAGVSAANMEEGNLRCDANISMREAGSLQPGTKVEIKNLNSFRYVEKALEFEVGRQTAVLDSGREVEQETRLFDTARGVTEPLRSKEEAHDYRYFPEPDLMPLPADSKEVERIGAGLPELPASRRERFVRDCGLAPAQAATLAEERELAEYFEQAAAISGNPVETANWMLRELLARLNKPGRAAGGTVVPPSHLAELVRLVESGAISASQGKDVFEEMWATGKSAAAIARERAISQVSDPAALSGIVDRVFAENADLVERIKNGEDRLVGVLTGKALQASGGKANPQVIGRLIRERARR